MIKDINSKGQYPNIVSTPEELAACLIVSTFCKAVLSSRASSHPLRKVVITALQGRYKVETFDEKQCHTTVVSSNALLPLLCRNLPLFKQIDLFFTDSSCHVQLNQKEWKCSWTNTSEHTQSTSHNRIKPYLFNEEEIHPFLVALGVTDERGVVKASMRRKFVQINAFLESIGDLIEHLKGLNRPIRIVDAGCGKGYLTFAMAALFQRMSDIQASVIGIDSRPDVIATCCAVKDELSFHNLTFRMATIGSLEEDEAPDFLIALHACNTATDVALFKAIQCGAEAIAAAPCCQHELAPLIPPSILPMVFSHPVFAQKASSLLTDAFRCELLSACGYSVKAVEFVDPDHTPKNILLKAIKRGKKRPLNPDFHMLRRCLPSGILLERLLDQHGIL